MKRAGTLALMIIAAGLLLTACAGGAAESDAQKIRREYLSHESVKMNMSMTADYGDRIYEFEACWTGSDERGTLDIVSPENISGMTAVLDEKGGRLEFDGAFFETGTLFGDGLSPVNAPCILLDAWKNGYARDRSAENMGGESSAALTFDLDGGAVLRTWFDRETLLPIKAEITDNGYTVLTIKFGDVILE